MGFLDEVKRKQAEDSGTAKKGLADRNLPAHVLAVEPQLELLRDGLTAFARRLNAALPNVRASYQIDDFATLADLKQSSYEVNTEDTKGLCVKLSFICQCAGRVQFETDNRDVCDRTLDHLLSHGLKVKYRSHADWKFLFTLENHVPVSLQFAPHETERAVKLKIQNLDAIGERLEHLNPEILDETFLDQLKKSVLREPNNFNQLCGNQVTEDIRAQFQERIAARQREREQREATPTKKPADCADCWESSE